MKNSLLTIVAAIALISVTKSLSWAQTDPSTLNQQDECKNVVPFLACDFGRFGCKLNIAISSGAYRCAESIFQIDGYGTGYLPTRSLPANSIPIMVAVGGRRPEMVKLVLKYNADTEIRDSQLGLTPLLRLTSVSSEEPSENDLQILDILLENGANPDAANENGDTALMLSAMFGRTGYVERLVRKSASLNVQNRKGQTALMLAADDERILKLLAATNLFTRDEKGRTAVFYAIEKCQPNKLGFLLSRKPELLKIRDTEGLLPREFAATREIQSRCPQIEKELR